MFKRIAVILILVMVVSAVPLTAVARDGVPVDTSRVAKGLVAVEYGGTPGSQMRVTVENLSREAERYVYHLQPGVRDTFPLQLGNGQYQVTVLEHVEGNLYRPLRRESFPVELGGDQVIYLQSVQNVRWDEGSAAVKMAEELTRDAEGDWEKVQLVYDYLVQNMAYDYQKVGNLASGYLPDGDETLKTQKGICYDFASLFAAILRSQGIPTRLVMGRAQGVSGYHAWNEVYLADRGQWLVIDVTTDIQLEAAGRPYQMVKDGAAYSKERVY